MTAVELVAECQARNIVLEPSGGQLDIDAPRAALTPELLALLSDGYAYEREEREAIAWCETGPANEVDAALRAAIDGFEKLYRGEGLEPVEVDAHGGAGQDLAAVAAPRPQSSVPVEWPAAAADFVLLLASDDLPPAPFRLNAWTEVRDAGKMLGWLRAHIVRGPGGPRAFYGGLQADLLALQRFALAAQSARVGSSDDAFLPPSRKGA